MPVIKSNVKERHMPRRFCIVALLLAAVATAVAAPLLPRKQRPPDEVLSLAQVDAARIEIQPLPRVLTAAGVKIEDLRTTFAAALGEAGVKPIDDPAAPVFVLRYIVVDPANPNPAALLCFVEFQQSVKITRLDDAQLTLPTITFMTADVVRHDAMAERAASLLKQMNEHVAAAIKAAKEE
jgi:hypothetical protein